MKVALLYRLRQRQIMFFICALIQFRHFKLELLVSLFDKFSIKLNLLTLQQPNNMSSPTRYRTTTFSPIRNIDERFSPSRNLDTILEESVSSRKSLKEQAAQVNKYKSKYSLPSPSYRKPYTDRRLLVENERLRNDNQILASSKTYTSVTYGKELDAKDSEIDALKREFALVEDRYEKQNTTLRLENDSLRKNLILIQNQKCEQIDILKQRYLIMPEERQQEIRKSYEGDIKKTLMDLQTAHLLLNEKQRELQHLSLIWKQNSAEYGINLEDLISQNNILKNKLLQFQMSSEKEMRQMSARKELQKSRTQGIISYCKENTLYIEKQINRLADELLKKNISIESFSRQITKYQKLIEEQGRRHDDELHRTRKQHEEIMSDKEKSFSRYEKQFKLDLAQKKRIELQLIEKISSMETEIQTLHKKLDFANQTIDDKNNLIRELKDSIQRKQEDHAKQISKVMSESKIKRKSAKNLSSYSSFKDIEEAQGSSIIKSGNLRRQQSILDEGGPSTLPIVREQENLARSQGFAIGEEDNYDMSKIVIHYESIIEELKRNKLTELSIANNKIESLKQSLNQKQQQMLDLLNRFSPLMEYKMSHEDIDEERRRKIEEHQRADIDLLDVMLQKYDIVALRRKL